MKRLNRRDFIHLFAGAVVSAFALPKVAYANGVSDNLVQFSPSVALEIAGMFADNNLNAGLSAENPIPLLDMRGNQIGWSVDYIKNGNPHGYILLDTTVDGLISRYSQLEGTTNLCSSSAAEASVQSCSLEAVPKLVSISPLDFGVLDEQTGAVYSKTMGITSLNDNVRATATNWNSLMIDLVDIYRNPYTVSAQDFTGDFWFLTESQIIKHTGKYACGITALFTIAGLTQNGNKFLIDTTSENAVDWTAYSQLWNATATTVADSSNGFSLGSTAFNNLGPGFSSYCFNQHGYTQTSSSKWNPTFGDYKSQVSKRKHSIFSARITKKDGSEDGHIMAVNGWATVKKGSSTINGLYVFDGWDDLVFLNTSFNGYVTTHGTFF